MRELLHPHCRAPSHQHSLYSLLSHGGRTNVVVVAVTQDHHVAQRTSVVERPPVVVVDGYGLDELAQARYSDLRVIRPSATASVEEKDRVCCRSELSVDERMLVIDVVDFDNQECA